MSLTTCLVCDRSYQHESMCPATHEGKTHLELLRHCATEAYEWNPVNDLTCMCCCLSLKVSYFFLQMICEKNTRNNPLTDKLETLKPIDGVQKNCHPAANGNRATCCLCHNSCDVLAGLERPVGPHTVLRWLEQFIDVDVPIKVCDRCSKALQVFQTLLMHVRRSENMFLNPRAQHICDPIELSEELYLVEKLEVGKNSDSNYDDGFNQAPCEFSPTHFQAEEISALATKLEEPLEEQRAEEMQVYTEPVEETRMEQQIEKFTEMPEVLHNKQAFQCSQCKRQFPSQKNLRTHITTKHGVASGCKQQSKGCFQCKNCGKSYNFKCQLGSHQRFCTKRKTVPCNFCSETFVDVAMFERHIRANHNIEVTHQCEVCSAQFKTAVRLARHRQRHSQRHAQCELCPHNYINQAELRTHMELKHGVGKKYACRYCPEEFGNVHEMRQHTTDLFKCSYCDFVANSRGSMRKHQFKHTGKPYCCRICNKTFEARSSFRQHASRQHGVQVTDEECSQQFQQKFGRISRHDAFSSALNNLEIEGIDEEIIETELQRDYDTTLDRMAAYLFKECEN